MVHPAYIYDVFKPGDLAEPGQLWKTLKEFRAEGRGVKILIDAERYIVTPDVDIRTIKYGDNSVPILTTIGPEGFLCVCTNLARRRGDRGYDRLVKEEEVVQVLVQNLDMGFGKEEQ